MVDLFGRITGIMRKSSHGSELSLRSLEQFESGLGVDRKDKIRSCESISAASAS
jgi:hypothetical protein